jgi:hypothetical protein
MATGKGDPSELLLIKKKRDGLYEMRSRFEFNKSAFFSPGATFIS